MKGLVALIVVGAIALTGFLLARWICARAFGVRGRKAVVGTDNAAWASASFARRAVFTLAGPFGYYVAIALVFAFALLSSGQTVIDEESMRVQVAPDGPAAVAGVRSGDRIVSVAGARVASWSELKEEVSHHAGEEVPLDVERDGTNISLRVTPKGPSGAAKIMVGPFAEIRQIGLFAALGQGFAWPPKIWFLSVRSFGRIFSGRDKPELSGPVGIVRETNDVPKTADSVKVAALLAAYVFWGVLFVALLLFPRAKKNATEAKRLT